MHKELNNIGENLTKIISSNLNDAEKSREINFLIRKDHIYIKRNSLKTIEISECATIDAKDTKTSLSSSDLEKEYIKIYGYSFGPIKPNFYFAPENLRILWVLKEPLLFDLNQMEGRIEGISQDQFYSTWEQIECDEWKDKQNRAIGTKTSIIEITQNIFKNLIYDHNLDNKYPMILNAYKDKTAVLNHLSIIELNYFPGIVRNNNWNSNDHKLKDWAKNNRTIINQLSNLYQPHIVFFIRDFGDVIATYKDKGKQVNYKTSIFNVAHATNIVNTTPLDNLLNSYPNSMIAGRDIVDCGPISTHTQQGRTIKCSYLIDSKKCIWIGFHHPTSSNWDNSNIKIISDLISKYL